MNHYVCAVLAGLLCGCASVPDDRDIVSAAITQRSGYPLPGVIPGAGPLPPSLMLSDGLSEGKAVTIALWNNAGFCEVLADLGLARADLIQAGLLSNPTLTALFPMGPKQLEFTAKFPLEALWLRPKRVSAAKIDYEKTAQRLVQNGLDLIRDVKVAFADAMLAEQRLAFGHATLNLTAQIEQLASARLAAGDASELEAGTARIDSFQAADFVARLRHDATTAADRLRNLLGVGLMAWPKIITDPPPSTNVWIEPDVSLLLTNALAARPDLRAAELGIETAGKRAGLARAEVIALTGLLDANGSGSSFEIGPGVDFSIPLFHRNPGNVAVARAKLEKAARHYTAVRDRIVLEVREAHSRLAQAQESLDQWRERILPPFQEAARQAGKAYEAGEVSFLLVLEMRRKLVEARAKEAIVLADVSRATAELERSIGGRLPAQTNPVGTHENAKR